ncbi:MAG: phosphoenolpyruvate carboxykinase domain-containing protein, partial [bacterium]
HVADYWQHWIDMGKSVPNLPKIFHVNWFRTDDEGHFLWPGFGENMRVVEWILKRTFNEVDAVETPIGYMPKPEDINLEGIEDEVSMDTLKELLTVDKEVWLQEAKGIEEFFNQVGEGKLPVELAECLETLKANLQK